MDRQHAERVYFEQIKRVVPLERVLDRYGVLSTLKGRGATRRGCCPIHDGTNAGQFHVDLDKNVWHCFGDCNRGGAQLEFVAEMERVGIRDAALMIARWFAIESGNVISQQSQGRRTSMAAGDKPTHKVFSVQKREGQDDWLTRIGSAWPHKNGKGMSILLTALPLGEKVVLFEYTDEDEKEEEQQKTKARKK